MTEISFVMWNCSGILPSSSIEDKLHFLLNNFPNFDVLVLVETHHKNSKEIPSVLEAYKSSYTLFHTEAAEDDPYAGIVVLVTKNINVSSHTVLLRGRLLNLKLDVKGKEYSMSAFYGYSGHRATLTKIKMITDILGAYHDKGTDNILLGDFNFVDNDLDRTSRGRNGMNHLDRTLRDTWLQFLDCNDITDPFRVRNPKRRMYSYIHTQHNAKSRLDRVYLNDERSGDLQKYKHTPTPFLKTHRIVSFSICKTGQRGPGYWKMNTSIISDSVYTKIVEETSKDVARLEADAIEKWLIFIETIRIETRYYCNKKRYWERKLKDLCEKRMFDLENNEKLSMDSRLQDEYDYYTKLLDTWNKNRIEGFKARIRTIPKFEFNEPDISFFSNLEKKSAKRHMITQLIDNNGDIKHDTEDLKKIVTEYYIDLFSEKNTSTAKTSKLLGNISKKLTQAQRLDMDRDITLEELGKAVMKLQKGKSPGPDGIPAEFYQAYWPHIQNLYLDFINAVKLTTFPKSKNTSITILIYKEKGEITLLKNYRPIALMNTDVKILTKLLAMRLKHILPHIIHESQTAVYGRHIGNNINLIRDLIDLANKNDEEAAFLFIDQEKAFDRVNHKVLYEVLHGFGFGNAFVNWIKTIYLGASTRVSVNGFLTENIPLKSGVRQGCPLSALLYVMVIELLALQLRNNLNIVGFTINGEKLISSHYADDAVIKITQNQCFKEVYKDLLLYEEATGAKVNFEKTKGLWVGKWKYRTDDPFQDLILEKNKTIKWSSKNVKMLGVYVGNDNPALETFQEIAPDVKRRLHFWKPLRLPILSKARVIEIFHASKLWFAASFYPIPPAIEKDLQSAFLDYLSFPKKKNEISTLEMQKLREDGGIKLISIKHKAEVPKINWLIKMVIDNTLELQKIAASTLVGMQKSGLSLLDTIFSDPSYVKKYFNSTSSFYDEAIKAVTKLRIWKKSPTIREERFFYNPIFTSEGTDEDDFHEKTIEPFKGNKQLAQIITFGALLDAQTTLTEPKLKAAVRRKLESITYIRPDVDDHLIIGHDHKEYKFSLITQKFLYSELVHLDYKDHSYQTKWALENDDIDLIQWEKIWESVYDNFHSDAVRSTIWEQIHLNFYTTYNYNKWHNSLTPCPLCRQIPEDVFHIFFDCKYTKELWQRLQNTLLKIDARNISNHEKAFGLQARNRQEKSSTILRNYITFSLRHHIMVEERKAYHRKSVTQANKFLHDFNLFLLKELKEKSILYKLRGLQTKFENIVTTNEVVASKCAQEGEEYTWFNIM